MLAFGYNPTMGDIRDILSELAQLIESGEFRELETDTTEIKPVPSDTGSWRECYKSICAFLNTRGGVLIVGIEEHSSPRRYVFRGWRSEAEPKLKATELRPLFTDKFGQPLGDLETRFPSLQIHPFLTGQVAVLFVDELPADQKFAFYRGEAYRREGTGDHRLSEAVIDAQEEYKHELIQSRELRPVPDTGLADVDLDKLNDFISQLNKPSRVETIKASVEDALPFLHRRSFVAGVQLTTLGVLVCGQHPGDHLGFRCHVHGYIDVPNDIARDKRDMIDNILPLMESAYGYVLRSIQIGITAAQGGSSRAEYPEELVRETVNNALAHRDYSINKQIIVAIKPNQHVAITNPGTFRRHLLIDHPDAVGSIRRIIPEAKPRNPKLADVLRLYRKWEGRGIGMATMVDMALSNRIDLPYYLFRTEEVTLHLCSGQLVDEKMVQLFESYSSYIRKKLDGRPLTDAQQRVLAYLIKSEWANEQLRYTILLTPDNNHFNELRALQKAGLISPHPRSPEHHPVYLPDRILVQSRFTAELRELFGPGVADLRPLHQDVLNATYRISRFSEDDAVTAKQISFSLWYQDNLGSASDIKGFDQFYRRVRRAFNDLEEDEFLVKIDRKRRGSPLYILNSQRDSTHLL